jgi:DNA-binding MarR family transcriptional regulator
VAADDGSAVRALAFVARALERSLEDMTLPQYRVLRLVASSPERASRIAERAAVSRPSLSGILDGIEARGWINRVEVEGDRRGVRPVPTEAGLQALRRAEAAMAAELDDVLASLPRGDASAVRQSLVLLGEALATRAAARST